MLAMPQPSAAEGLSELWAMLHRDAPLVLLDRERHYLTALALGVDDELVSHLLLRKLRLARTASAARMPREVVRLNSRVEFAQGGERRLCQLLHPSAPSMPADGLSTASRTGAGLIGLAAGQAILWPAADGRMRDLEVLRVEN